MPCLTNPQIASIIEAIDRTYDFLIQHVDTNSGASRFGELNAYFQNDLIGGFIPCGKVAADQDSIGIGQIRLRGLEVAKQVLLSATPDTKAPPPELTGDHCEDLINAINNINVSLDLSDISLYVQLELNKFAVTLMQDIESLVASEISIVLDYNADIINKVNNVQSKTNVISFSVEEVYSLLSVKVTEILERIHDTRVELRQTAVRVIQVWKCLHTPDSTVESPVCKPLEVDIEALSVSLLNGLSVFMNPLFSIESSLREHITKEILSVSVGLIGAIGVCCDSLTSLVNQKTGLLVTIINNPTWLSSVSKELEVLISQSSALQTRLTSIFQAIGSLSQTTEEGDVINYVYHNTTTYNSYNNNQITAEPVNVDVAAILSAISSVGAIVESINRCVCIEFHGEIELSNCQEQIPPEVFPYTGKGLKGISDQMVSIASAMDKIGKRACDSSNVAVILPSDKYGELDCNRQLTLYFGLKYPYFGHSSWRISLPQPRTDLSWADFDGLIWERGSFTHSVRFSLDGGSTFPRKNATWGAFKSREIGIDFFDRVLTLIDPSVKFLRSNGDGRMVKRVPSAKTRCVRAMITDIDNETGEVASSYCYSPPR
ncbi:MAG: hypothetical protein RIM23_09925 [Coleofasciculus sp. G3-WIS-01]|uniref:hypothetical protein n=1 Tax=Coleofasciculus sp. G3-WIS-01 TaxID=3069528 RepID=UPI0032FA1F14